MTQQHGNLDPNIHYQQVTEILHSPGKDRMYHCANGHYLSNLEAQEAKGNCPSCGLPLADFNNIGWRHNHPEVAAAEQAAAQIPEGGDSGGKKEDEGEEGKKEGLLGAISAQVKDLLS